MSNHSEKEMEQYIRGNNAEDETVDWLPDKEQKIDPLVGARVRTFVHHVAYFDAVEAVDIGSVSKERLYKIRYEDGDLEHVTAAQIKKRLVLA